MILNNHNNNHSKDNHIINHNDNNHNQNNCKNYYPCDKQGYCNRVLDFYCKKFVNRFQHVRSTRQTNAVSAYYLQSLVYYNFH